MAKMTPKERAVAALNLQVPDMVPTFELEFQLAEEMFGRNIFDPRETQKSFAQKSPKERERHIREAAEFTVEVYTALEYSIIPIPSYAGYLSEEDLHLYHRSIRGLVGDTMIIGYHGDGTFAIPDGTAMYEFAYRMADDPQGLKDEARRMADAAIERNKRFQENGVDCLLLCSDYCYNSGPFLSPASFREFIQPYLYQIIDAARKDGLYTIKHTDGNIMPILDQLVECRPHALHSLDPMAGVDIKVVKELVGDKVALCGNVHCAALQTGTEQDVIDSCEYCLTYGKPGGGYIFSTSNVPFKGMDPKRYELVLSVWKRMREY